MPWLYPGYNPFLILFVPNSHFLLSIHFFKSSNIAYRGHMTISIVLQHLSCLEHTGFGPAVLGLHLIVLMSYCYVLFSIGQYHSEEHLLLYGYSGVHAAVYQ
jgi:hypothetical protein